MDTTPNHVSLCDDEEEEEYIHIELRSSPPQTTEFEFQMSGSSSTKPTTTSPADELFYKGKLLPLHLPPRRLMLQTLLSASPSSPSESRRLSCELNPHDYFFEWSGELDSSVNNHPAKLSRSKRLKKSILHASTTFLRSFFTASRSSENRSFGHIEERRRSFSGAIKRHSPAKCLSSSSSNSSSSSSSSELLSLRRSSSATEIEVSIQAAIAHCKKSSTKTCSLIGDVD